MKIELINNFQHWPKGTELDVLWTAQDLDWNNLYVLKSDWNITIPSDFAKCVDLERSEKYPVRLEPFPQSFKYLASLGVESVAMLMDVVESQGDYFISADLEYLYLENYSKLVAVVEQKDSRFFIRPATPQDI